MKTQTNLQGATCYKSMLKIQDKNTNKIHVFISADFKDCLDNALACTKDYHVIERKVHCLFNLKYNCFVDFFGNIQE